MIAYYAPKWDVDSWNTAWASRRLGAEIVTLRHSPLLALVLEHLPPPATVRKLIDAGCGLGAWVAVLMEHGYLVTGLDAVMPPPSNLPVYQARAENLWMCANGSADVYLSLGVIEHEELGPDKILREAHRVLSSLHGTALVSVPYVNGLRRLLWPWIALRQWWKRMQGEHFYQYAYTKRELIAALSRNGFTVRSTHPYGPTKMFRTWFSERTRDGYDAARPLSESGQPRWRRAVRWLLYTRPLLRLCGHMLLAVAVKK